MTAPLRDPDRFTKFDVWVNTHPELHSKRQGLYVMDIDKVFFRYKIDAEVRVLLLEYKEHGAPFDQRQGEIITVLNQVLQYGADGGITVSVLRGRKRFAYYGYHRLQMSGTTPDDSACMRWDGQHIDKPALIKLLRCESRIADARG